MKKIELEETKHIQLNILKEVDKFCREKGLRYSLAAGTLIGAIRHKGYIPWDDDIDIMMPRPDYLTFLKEFKGYSEHLIAGAYENDKNYSYNFAKIYDDRTYLTEYDVFTGLGIHIDLFPIDGYPDSEKDVIKFSQRMFFLQNLLTKKVFWNTCKHSKIKSFLMSMLSISMIQKRISKLAQKYSYETSNTLGAVLGRNYYKKERNPHAVFDDYINIPFENLNCMVIKEYDKYLKRLYGNYMQLPPIEEQVLRHAFVAFWKS
jgi:lipopolysaccharide cholinephosphotransferase